jgi:hypothetical protein
VFGSAIRARVNLPASASTARLFPSPKETALLAAAAFWVVVLGVLFAGWLMTVNSAQMRAWKRDLASVCVSLGKGGALCAERPANDKGASDQFDPAGDCAALGKGGRVCFGRAVVEKGTN